MALQEELGQRVVREDRLGEVGGIAGVDVGYERHEQVSRAAVAVLSFPGLRLQESAVARAPAGFPYVPGLLSFREVPAILAALERLKEPPALLLCDAQGYAHPRRFGLACHLGVLVDIPAIGVAKGRLVGAHEEVPPERGAWRPLVDRGEVVGAALRTRTGVRPVYVSPGHRVSLETALRLVLQAAPTYRLPEPIRLAHRLASGAALL